VTRGRSRVPASALVVEVIDRRRLPTRGAGSIARFIEAVGGVLPPASGGSVAIALLADAAMRRLNRTYRGRNATTDVLAFPGGGARDPAGHLHLGDIAISVPRAVRQAKEAGHSLACELRILALHGYLHLLGHDHEADRGEMATLQRRLIRRFSPPGSERAE
jgi:probable rRNA maturation factor